MCVCVCVCVCVCERERERVAKTNKLLISTASWAGCSDNNGLVKVKVLDVLALIFSSIGT